jgi:NitT/TauT family transport system permease protein
MNRASLQVEGAAADDLVRWEAIRVARRRQGVLFFQVLVGVCFLLLWEWVAGPFIDPFFISEPTAIWKKLVHLAGSGALLNHLSITLYATVLGFAIGSIVGFSTGFVFGRFQLVADVFDPYITAIYSLPKIALAPLFIMWFGIGIESKIAMAAVIVFFLVFLNTYSGVRDVNKIYIDTFKVIGATELQILRHVVWPSATTWVLTGLKVSVPYALIGTVVGEFMSSNRGMGYLIAESSALFDTAGVFAGLLVLGVVGAFINSMLKRVERRLLRWK